MKIAILGAVCFDEIFPLEGERRESFGGILYNAAALASILEDGDVAFPFTKIGEDRFEAALAEFEKLPNIDTSGILPCEGPATHVTLTWRTVSWRDEIIRHRMPPYTIDELQRVLPSDAVHINFINGTEIDLLTLKAFRDQYSGLISLDVHNIVSRFDAQGKRDIVGFPQWREWAPTIDVLQCNEFEINTMFDEEVKSRADFARAAKEVSQAGPRAVTITLGPEGAITVHRRDNTFYVVDIGVLPPVRAVDTTGCGDSFSAGFLVGMLRSGDPATALASGSVVAGVNTRYRGLGQLAEAKDYLRDPRSHFKVFEGKPTDWPGDPF
jgi:sugar/nucleoside kinase (ribokinase family)